MRGVQTTPFGRCARRLQLLCAMKVVNTQRTLTPLNSQALQPADSFKQKFAMHIENYDEVSSLRLSLRPSARRWTWVTLLLPPILFCSIASHAGTSGSFIGLSKSAQFFEFNMDGATSRSTSDYEEQVPRYATVGTAIRGVGGATLVQGARQLPAICSHRLFKSSEKPAQFVCTTGDHPMSNSMYRLKERHGDTRIYVCVRGCSNAIPATLSYSELE